MTAMPDQNCNVPDYYQWVNAVAFISAIGFSSCIAATSQVATTDRLYRLATQRHAPFNAPETNMDIEAGISITRAETTLYNSSTGPADGEKGALSAERPPRGKIWRSRVRRLRAFIMYMLLDRMNESIGEDGNRMKVALSMFAFSSTFYAIALVFSLTVQILLTWQPVARAVAQIGIVRVMISLYAYISVICVLLAVFTMGEALRTIKPMVGMLTKVRCLLSFAEALLTNMLTQGNNHTRPHTHLRSFVCGQGGSTIRGPWHAELCLVHGYMNALNSRVQWLYCLHD